MKPANRTEARAWWTRVAEGDLGVEQYDRVDLKEWMREVARDVLEADDLGDAKQRPYAVTKAVGLANREDPYAALHQLIDNPRYEFSAIDKVTGVAVDQTQAQLVAELAAEALKLGLLRGVYAEDPKRAKDLIRSLLKARMPKNN